MLKSSKKIKLASVLLVCFFLSGCAVEEKIGWLDQKAGEMFGDFQIEDINDIATTTEEVVEVEAKDLTDEQKEQIDKWLEENSFNRYGDSVDTIYAGGTPLFNEATGETIERFEYILEKQSDILQKIK